MSKDLTVSQLMKVDSGLTTEQIQKLFSKTPENKIKYRPAKGGGKWKYVEGTYVTQVLNSLFGFNWKFEILTPMADALLTAKTGTVVVQGKLSVKIGEEWVIKEQYGRKEVAFRKETTTPLDFGNDMKAAATDAKKKCASELGLFADVYSQDNFFEATVIDDSTKEDKKEKIRSLNESTTN
jgi:recombination DNA repair RAD52 pathway protein